MNLVLMAYGPWRFSIGSFSYEEMSRQFSARITSVPVIGARPPLHFLGPGEETIGFRATFFPYHLPGNTGLAQLASMRAALNEPTSFPLIGNRAGLGDVFGRWALQSLGETQTEIGPDGVGQKIEVEIELIFDGRSRSAGALSAIAALFR